MQEAMQCLEQELKESPADSKAHRILVFMVEKKLEELASGISEPQVFGRSSLHLNIEGEIKARTGDAARWLKPQLLESYLESRQSALIKRLEHAGVDELPIIRTEGSKGGKGIERTYWLDVEPIPDANNADEQASDFHQITYRRSEAGEVKPSLPLRLIFRKGQLMNRSWRGGLMFGVFLTGLLLWLAWFLLGIWGLADFEKALSLRQLGLTAFLMLCSWIIWAGTYRPWIRLVDELTFPLN